MKLTGAFQDKLFFCLAQKISSTVVDFKFSIFSHFALKISSIIYLSFFAGLFAVAR
jgi:hypothetical protein